MIERLIIHNFKGIRNADIELNVYKNVIVTHRDGYNVLFTPQKITFPIHLTLLSKIILDSCFN